MIGRYQGIWKGHAHMTVTQTVVATIAATAVSGTLVTAAVMVGAALTRKNTPPTAALTEDTDT